MIAFAKAEFPLWKIPKGAKITERQVLEQVERTTKKKPAKLAALPPFPEKIRYVWNWFLTLSVPGTPLAFQEIQAFSEMACLGINAAEAKLLKQLDTIRQNA